MNTPNADTADTVESVTADMLKAAGNYGEDILRSQVRSWAHRLSALPKQPFFSPERPTQSMLDAARDWSYKKYGQAIGNDAAIGCWNAMLKAAPEPVPSGAAEALDVVDATCMALQSKAHGLLAIPKGWARSEDGFAYGLYLDRRGILRFTATGKRRMEDGQIGLVPAPTPPAAGVSHGEAVEGKPAGWSYEWHNFGDVWTRHCILNRPDGGANPPTKHHGQTIRNVRPFYYTAQPEEPK